MLLRGLTPGLFAQADPSPWECSDSSLHKDEEAALTPKSRTTCPLSCPCKGVKRSYFSIGLGASVSRGRGKMLGFPPSASCAPQGKKRKNSPFRDPSSSGTRLRPVGKEAYTLRPAMHLGSATVPSSSTHPKSADPFSARHKTCWTHSSPRHTQKPDPLSRRSCPSLQLHPYPRVLAPRSRSARSREQREAPSSAPLRVRNPCLGLERDATSVPSGRCLDLGSRALSGYESPGSEWEPYSRRRSAEENNATARSSGLGPSRPARLPAGPASGPPLGPCDQ